MSQTTPTPDFSSMSLRLRQELFVKLVTKLLTKITSEPGHSVTFGETYRPPETAELYARQNRGVRESLHTYRLAIDLNIFRFDQLLKKTEDYRIFGDYWKTLHPLARWGGDFSHRPDGNHFSLEYQGMA